MAKQSHDIGVRKRKTNDEAKRLAKELSQQQRTNDTRRDEER